jgi:hypothetical protein
LLSVLVFPASVVEPVHVVKRKGSLKPATIAQFFDRLQRVASVARVKQKAATR